MSEEIVVNGGAGDGEVDVEVAGREEDSGETTNPNIQKLMQKISILEQEKLELITGKQSATEKIKQLEDEIERSESDKKALSSIAARAAQLETEVSRLQHDLISSMTEGQESNAELSELKRSVAELKNRESEKTEKIVVIEKERNLLLERLNEDAEKLKACENQIRDLERKIESFVARDSSQKSERFKAEEEANVKINEKNDQIRSLKKIVDEFQSVVAKNRADMERTKQEKQELEVGKDDLEALLKKSERQVKDMDQKMDQLRRELEAYEKINTVLKEKMVEDTNGLEKKGVVNGDQTRLMGLKLDWPVVAATATAGAIATAAVVYFRHSKF